MAGFFETSAAAGLSAIRRGEVSTRELISPFLSRIGENNGVLHAVRHILDDEARKAASAIDALVQSGEALPRLAGLPVLIKENCDTAGVPCSAGMRVRTGHVPETDSWITARLRALGAIVLGVTVSDPGAFSVRTPDVTHPADPTLTVGGSSGGSAAAVAAGFCLGAIGTDTGGSIRIPSACCGTVGLKPTYNALPVTGIFPLIPSLDHVGPMARTVEDVTLLWDALRINAGADAKAVTSIGFDPVWLSEADAAIRDAFELVLAQIEKQGVACREIRLPKLDEVAEMHGRIFFTEGAAYHFAHFKTAIPRYPSLARQWFALARGMPVGDYVDAWERRVRFTSEVDRLLEEVDLLLTPTLPVLHPPRDGQNLIVAGRPLDYTMALVRQTCLFDHTGHPALAMPVPFASSDASGSVSPSLQIVGRPGEENSLLAFARVLERILPDNAP